MIPKIASYVDSDQRTTRKISASVYADRIRKFHCTRTANMLGTRLEPAHGHPRGKIVKPKISFRFRRLSWQGLRIKTRICSYACLSLVKTKDYTLLMSSVHFYDFYGLRNVTHTVVLTTRIVSAAFTAKIG